VQLRVKVAKDGSQDEGALDVLEGALGFITPREGFILFCETNKRVHEIRIACDESVIEVCKT
jgi:hypothetical protein